MSTAFTVTRLSTTPVKGLMLHHPDSIELTTLGAVGDRRFLLVDDDGKLQSATANQGLFGLSAAYDTADHRLEISQDGDVLLAGTIEPDAPVDADMFGLRTLPTDVVAGQEWHDFFSDRIGRGVRLLRASAPAVDVHPATLLGTASVDELARRSGAEIDPRRFRMLIEFSGGQPHVEDSWHGRTLEVGGATLRAGGPVKRCAATTRDPDTGAVTLQTLRLITDYRGRQESELGVGANFGVYADVLEPGRITVGDVVGVHDA